MHSRWLLESKEGEFEPKPLNEGQRDAYYLNKVNPVPLLRRGIAILTEKHLMLTQVHDRERSPFNNLSKRAT